VKKNVYVALCSGQTQIMSFAYIYVTLYMVHKYMIRVVTGWCTYIHTYIHAHVTHVVSLVDGGWVFYCHVLVSMWMYTYMRTWWMGIRKQKSEVCQDLDFRAGTLVRTATKPASLHWVSKQSNTCSFNQDKDLI
jgi:hypothetical protein